jgi:hypothetical protein
MQLECVDLELHVFSETSQQTTPRNIPMKSRFKYTLAAALGGLMFASASARATLTFTGGLGDLTFYYESAADRWDIVFQNKTSTQATGNTTAYSGFTGIVGGSASNVTFNALQINVSSAPLATVNSNGYFITPANGTSYQNQTTPTLINQPDLGIRTRLREDQVALESGTDIQANQFTSMRLTLDWANSTRPAGGEFIMFKYNSTLEQNEILYETVDGNLIHDWGNYGHTHWHFGFSEIGDYSLVFNVEGVGGTYGDTSGTSQVTLNFNVIPEPSTALLGMFAVGALGLRRRRN